MPRKKAFYMTKTGYEAHIAGPIEGKTLCGKAIDREAGKYASEIICGVCDSIRHNTLRRRRQRK